MQRINMHERAAGIETHFKQVSRTKYIFYNNIFFLLPLSMPALLSFDS